MQEERNSNKIMISNEGIHAVQCARGDFLNYHISCSNVPRGRHSRMYHNLCFWVVGCRRSRETSTNCGRPVFISCRGSAHASSKSLISRSIPVIVALRLDISIPLMKDVIRKRQGMRESTDRLSRARRTALRPSPCCRGLRAALALAPLDVFRTTRPPTSAGLVFWLQLTRLFGLGGEVPFDCRHETCDESDEQDEEEYPRRCQGGEEREV